MTAQSRKYRCVLSVIGICDFETDDSQKAAEHEMNSWGTDGPIHIVREVKPFLGETFENCRP